MTSIHFLILFKLLIKSQLRVIYYLNKMKKFSSTSFFFLITSILFAQNESNLPKQFLQFTAGRSTHGTGDVRGLSFNSVYSNFFKKRFSWIAEVGGSLHDGNRALFFTAPNGEFIDGSIRYTTGGIQSSLGIGYSAIKTSEHEIQVRLSSLFRYQSSSYYDDVTVLYPAATGLPFPVIIFNNKTPQRTFAFGGIGAIAYNYTIKNKMTFGLLAGIQTDTNGDTITQLLFSVGKRF